MTTTTEPMKRALRLAWRARGNTAPNPMVGALVVDDTTGQVLGEGYHHRAGGPHAEVLALTHAGAHSRGQTLYVTLEPCNHTGRTPPCTEAIIAAGIRTVYVAILDPNPSVRGGGVTRLRQAGITVHVGMLGEQAFALNRPFFCWALLHRPLVILKSALTLDGKVATAGGESKYLTHAQALAWAHEERRLADAILVGVTTVLQDDPQLTYRGRRKGQDPVRIVLDSQGRTPADAELFRSGSPAPTLVFTGEHSPVDWERNIFTAGGEVIRCPLDSHGRVPLYQVMEALADRRLDRLLVEGGPTIHASFVVAGLADHWLGFLAPRFLGADGLSALGRLTYEHLDQAPELTIRRVRALGDDALIEADFNASPMIQAPPELIKEDG